MENIIIEAQFVAHINYYYAALRHSFFFCNCMETLLDSVLIGHY